MKRLRPTRNLLLLALGVSALVASFGIALAATVQVTKEIPSTVDVIDVDVISGDNLIVSYDQDGNEPVTSLEITLVDLQPPLDSLGWNQVIYLRNDSEENLTIIAPYVHVRDEITDLQIGFLGLNEYDGPGHACDNNWTIDSGETVRGNLHVQLDDDTDVGPGSYSFPVIIGAISEPIVAVPTATSTPPTPPASTPTGEATIEVRLIAHGVGTPRYCSAGCSENVYITGIMETLFRPVYGDTLGALPEQGVLRTGFTLDPGLQYMDFDLRQGVPFHDGWGKMTARDVAFSFNDANRNTEPTSIHGQAGDFAPLIRNIEVLDTYKVRLNFENYDSRGIRHRFNSFWQSAGITSRAVFNEKGPDGMRDFVIGTGPFRSQEWIAADRIILEAVPNHWRKTSSLAKITLQAIPDANTRRAALETGQIVMAQAALADWNNLIGQGFELNTDSGHGIIRNVGMTGNYWEDNRYYDGLPLVRGTVDRAWVSDDAFGEAYEKARLVRLALAHAIDRQALVDSVLSGFGDGPMYFGYQPPNDHPITQSHAYPYDDLTGGSGGWEYPVDYALARHFLADGDYPGGFAMSNVWTGPPGLPSALMTAVGAAWDTELGVNVTLNNSVYSTYRPGLVARTTSEPFVGCGDDANTAMPYDWARGFVMSS